MRTEEPEPQTHWHRREASSTIGIAHQHFRRHCICQTRRCSRCYNICSGLAAVVLHRLEVGVHGLECASPGAIDRRAFMHFGPGPHAQPDRAGLAAEVDVPLAGRAASFADDPVCQDLRVMVHFAPAAVCYQCPARLA